MCPLFQAKRERLMNDDDLEAGELKREAEDRRPVDVDDEPAADTVKVPPNHKSRANVKRSRHRASRINDAQIQKPRRSKMKMERLMSYPKPSKR